MQAATIMKTPHGVRNPRDHVRPRLVVKPVGSSAMGGSGFRRTLGESKCH